MTTSALERLVRRSAAASPTGSPAAVEHCHLCSAPLPERHRHVLDELAVDGDAVLCACPACALLFEREAAGRGHYRLVPQRRQRLPDEPDLALGAPVGLAFYVPGPTGGALARYPSPLGVTTAEIDVDRWAAAVAACPALASLEPRVEALLVDASRGAHERWIVPLDDCYRLVALVGRLWSGFTGGDAVRQGVRAFFEDLAGADRRRHG